MTPKKPRCESRLSFSRYSAVFWMRRQHLLSSPPNLLLSSGKRLSDVLPHNQDSPILQPFFCVPVFATAFHQFQYVAAISVATMRHLPPIFSKHSHFNTSLSTYFCCVSARLVLKTICVPISLEISTINKSASKIITTALL